MKRIVNPAEQEWAALLQRPTMDLEEIEKLVRPVMEAVRDQGPATEPDPDRTRARPLRP